MTIKTTVASLEKSLPSRLGEFKSRATAAKEAYQAKRRDILQNDRLSDTARTSDLAKLLDAHRKELDSIKAEQDTYVSGLTRSLESELRGSQPTDANSVLLRRDAADRVRKITSPQDAKDILQDAITNSDESLAHAIGIRAYNVGWLDVADTWKAAYPSTAETAAALSYVEANTSGAAYNLSNQITYSSSVE